MYVYVYLSVHIYVYVTEVTTYQVLCFRCQGIFNGPLDPFSHGGIHAQQTLLVTESVFYVIRVSAMRQIYCLILDKDKDTDRLESHRLWN